MARHKSHNSQKVSASLEYIPWLFFNQFLSPTNDSKMTREFILVVYLECVLYCHEI